MPAVRPQLPWKQSIPDGVASAQLAVAWAQLVVASAQLALAWLLKRSPAMLPIPGTSSVGHLIENTAAAGLELSEDEYAALNAAGR